MGEVPLKGAPRKTRLFEEKYRSLHCIKWLLTFGGDFAEFVVFCNYAPAPIPKAMELSSRLDGEAGEAGEARVEGIVPVVSW